MKRFFIALIVTLIAVYLFYLTKPSYMGIYTALSDSFFIIGMVLFCVSLISLTDATKMFQFIGYGFKSVFRRKNLKYKSYYEYQKDRQREGMVPYMTQLFVISIGYIIAAGILAHYSLQ